MDSLTVLMYIIVLLLGITVGSFLNVCIFRIPEGESIVFGPSHCPNCGRRLKWYELIPIFSFLALRGRCKGCRNAISAQYPLIEATNGVLWVIVFAVMGFSAQAALGCLLSSTLLVLGVVDARTLEIPSGTTIAILVLGAIATGIDYQNWLSHLIGLFAISLPLLLVLLITGGRGIGGGDIKLMAGCGLFLGWKLIILGFFGGCLLGALIHLCLMAAKKAGRTLSFGPYLALGVVLSMLWGDRLISWYVSMFL